MLDDENKIAVIGLSGRFPEADNLKEFWDNISSGRNCITRFADEDIDDHEHKSLLGNPNYVRSKGFLKGSSLFDANFFDCSRREAELMDPQQRVMLETVYESLYHAGYNDRDDYEIGLFLSSSFNTYFPSIIKFKPDLYGPKTFYQSTMASSNDFLATRIAYKLNLQGPAQTVQTACSSSLVAIHNARQSLLNYECDIMVAGGVSITCPLKSGYLYMEGGIGSQDGVCRPFDDSGNGTVPGNGAGAVVLKRYEDALQDGDYIYAVISGSAINNDGRDKQSYTSPSVRGQTEVIRMAQEIADIKPEDVGYIETHGTGTKLGDPIEVEALKQSFSSERKSFDDKQCALGSIKANIGHLDAASGVTGFIKAVLSVEQGKIAPLINFNQINSHINLDESPFFINTELREWIPGKKKVAGVSSFGIGGTNAHVIIEEPNNQSVEKKDFFLRERLFKNQEEFWIKDESKKSPVVALPDRKVFSSTLNVSEHLRGIVKNLTGETEVFDDITFAEQNIDSLTMVDFILKIEEAIGIKLYERDIEEHNNIISLVNYIESNFQLKASKSKDKFSRRMVNLNSEVKDSINLFCFHPAGGSIAVFKDLAKNMDKQVNLVGVRGDLEEDISLKSIKEMACEYFKEIIEYQESEIFYLCGSSMGGLIAYEIANMLNDKGFQVGLLGLIDTPPPKIKINNIFSPKTEKEIFSYIDALSQSSSESLRKMRDNSPSNYERFMNLWKAHKLSIQQYIPGKICDSEIVYFRAKNLHSEAKFTKWEKDWIDYTYSSIDIKYIDGNHINMHEGLGAEKMSDIIRAKVFGAENVKLKSSYE